MHSLEMDLNYTIVDISKELEQKLYGSASPVLLYVRQVPSHQ